MLEEGPECSYLISEMQQWFFFLLRWWKKNLAPFYGWGSIVSSHYEETVYFLPLSSQKFLVLIWSTSEGWKAESTLEPPGATWWFWTQAMVRDSNALTTRPLLHGVVTWLTTLIGLFQRTRGVTNWRQTKINQNYTHWEENGWKKLHPTKNNKNFNFTSSGS